ncbi:MAG: glycosyltransferase family 2 protein, partial [Pseudomonadota bacterium]
VTVLMGWLGCVGLFEPWLALLGTSTLLFTVFAGLVTWRLWLLVVATTPGFRTTRTDNSSSLRPVYTILIALYREGSTINGLARAVSELDWPAQSKDIILLTEAGDAMTQTAISNAAWPQGTRVLVLPPGAPRTKPRALNYGLAHARGDYVCVYDAEDRPHASQLKAAEAAFKLGGRQLACVQAPLAGDNHRQSWLALHWTLEYAVQFGLLLPALSRLGLPLLLGGTSNHFRRSALMYENGWDAWNVTEDADLGVRLAARGYRTATITPPTFEEAPETLNVWIAQRSRWLKGFLQTWVVMMARPKRALKELGIWGFLSLQFGLIGTCLAALAHGPLILLTAAALAFGADLPVAAIILMAAGYGINAIAALIAPGPRGMRRWLGVFTLPLYWPLQSLAASRALYGYIRSPHFWAKTPHGVTSAQR